MLDEEGRRSSVRRPSTPASRRLLVVDAFIDLVLEGEGPPAPEDVADRAGVSRATFFRYFSSLGELRHDGYVRLLQRFPELLDIPTAGTGTLEERIEVFVETRLRLHEALHALEILMRSHAVGDADTAVFVDAARQVLADQVRQHFDADLQRHSRARRDDLVIAIAILTSVESWQQFRHSHGRSLEQTRRAWRGALTGILMQP